MMRKLLHLLVFSGFCTTASAALYRFSVANTIDSIRDFDPDSDQYQYIGAITTPYGDITAGATVTITLTYDTDGFSPVDGGSWSGGSYVQYSSATPAILSVTTSSGYSYTGPVNGAGTPFFDAVNQYTAHDQVNFKRADGGIFMQFNDFSGSQTFTNHPMIGLGAGAVNDAFVAGVNSGVMKLSNGLPSKLPGMGSDASVSSNSPGTVSLAPVPEPSHGILALVGLTGLLARRRRDPLERSHP